MSMEKYRINPANGLEFGIYTLGDHIPNPHTGERVSNQQRINEIIEFAQLAEQAGIDFFSVGESHQEYFTTQAHSVVLGAIAQATEKIKIAVLRQSSAHLILYVFMRISRPSIYYPMAVPRLLPDEHHA